MIRSQSIVNQPTTMIYLPNFLTILRFPLALLFIPNHYELRLAVLFFSMVSDGLDGLIARRYKLSTRLGTVLDPIMDKFFACIVLFIFWWEQKISIFEGLSFLSRDAAVLLYGIILALQGKLKTYRIEAIWFGKITTLFQFFVFFLLIWGITPPFFTYMIFIILGVFSFIELSLIKQKNIATENTS